MIKKYSKYLLTALFAFFVSLTGTSARELTIDELGNFVKEIEPDATYVYVIGEYVFTSEHILTTQDTMLAARSIKATDNSGDTKNDPIYNEMTIAYLEGVFDNDWNLIGLDYVKNVVGTSPEPEIYDVKYVDYKEIVTKVDVDSLVEKAFKTIEGQGATDKFKLAIEGNTVHVMLNDLEMNSIEAIGGTGIYTAALNFLKEEGIESVTLSLGNEKVTISTSSIDADEVEKFFKALGSKAGDLVGKDITAKIAFKEGYKTANSDSFTLKFTDIKKIDVDALIEKAYKTIEGQAAKDKLITKLNGKTIEVILVDLNMNSVDALGGTGVYTAALNFLKEEGIESVTLVYGDEDLILSSDSIDADEVEKFLKAIGSNASDLVGKKITAKLAFKIGYETLNSDEFILDIKEQEKVDVDALVEEAYNTILGQAAKDKFIIFKDGNKINVTLKDLEMNSVDALGGAGVYTAALNFLNEEGIASVTLKLGDEKVTVGDSLDKAEIESFFKALGNKAGDLVGKTMTATVAFEDGYKTANSTEFTINFGKYVDTEALVKKAYNTIKGQVDTDKFAISLNEGLIEVILMDSEMNSIEALAGTGVATAASNLLKEQGVNKVYLVLNDGSQYARLAMDKNTLDKTEAENFFKAIGSKAGDLIGKTLFLTIELEDGYETITRNKFDVVFKDATKVDVDKLVDNAYKTILGQAATDKFEISKDENNVNVLLKDLEMSSIDAIGGTGIYTAALNFLKENGIKSVILSLGDEKVEIGDSLDKTEIENFFKALGNKTGDLVGKTITATVAFEDGYKTANSTEFAINFGKYVDVDNLVEKAYETIEKQAATDKFVAKLDGTNIEVTIMDLEMNSADALMGTGLATAASNFLKEQGIASVKLTMGGKEFTVGTAIDADELEGFLKQFGSKAADLVGKEMTAEISFKDSFKTANSSKFTISFEDAIKVDVDNLVEKAYKTILDQAATDKFLVSMDENIRVVLVDLDMNSVDALAKTGVYTAALNFLNEEGIESVTLVYGDEDLTISATSIDADEVENFLKKLGNKASDLVGKKLTAKMTFKEGYKTANSDNFVIELAQMEKVDVNALVKKAYDVIEGQAAKDKFIATLDGTNIEVMLVDLNMNSVDALMGTGVATAATNFLNEKGIESVTLVYGTEKLTISKDSIDADEVEVFLKKLGNKASDLVGKKLTAKLAFKTGYETANANEFTINIVEEEKVDVNALVDKAYGIVEGQNAKDKILVELDDTNMIVTLIDLNMNSVDALMGTGIGTAITTFLNEEGIEKVTLSYGNASATLSYDHIDADEIETFLKTIGSKASDLVGKKIDVNIDFVEGYKTANSSKFTLDIREEEKVDVAALATSAYNHVSSKENDVFEAKLDGTDIEIVLKDLNTSSANALAGSGIGQAAIGFLNEEGVKSVCLTYSAHEICFDESNINFTEVQNFFNKLGTTTKDLLGKNIGVGILFEEGYKTSNVNNFMVSFSKYKYNVNFDVDGTKTTEKVDVGSTVSEPSAPTKEGYTFDKWLLNGTEYDFSTPISGEITLTASWTINTYKIKIVANDATMGKVSVAEVDAKYGTEINVLNNSVTIGNQTVVATPADANAQYTYSFTGWSNISTPVKNGMTITANFSRTVNKYTVTYVDSNTNTLGTQEVEYGTKISELTAPSKDGYVATNYLYNSNVVDKESTITGDVSYVVEYANAVSVNEVLSEDLENVKSSNYTAKLEDDTVVANFTNPNFDFSELTSVFEILDLLEGLTADKRYDSVKLSYDNDPAHQVELVGLSMFGAADVARFIGLVTAGQWSGTKGSEADVNKLVASTANKPITVTVTLKDGYADTNTASPVVDYYLVFTSDSLQ